MMPVGGSTAAPCRNGADPVAVNTDGPSRRQLITRGVTVLSGIVGWSTFGWPQAKEEVLHSEEAIHQENVFKASRKRVYEVLTETKHFAQLVKLSGVSESGSSKATQMSNQVGGTFVIFDGHIIGRQLELVSNERIVQAWRVADWDPGCFSIARFNLVDEGASTKIVFDHTGFPRGLGEHLASGWKEHYWDTMQKYLS